MMVEHGRCARPRLNAREHLILSDIIHGLRYMRFDGIYASSLHGATTLEHMKAAHSKADTRVHNMSQHIRHSALDHIEPLYDVGYCMSCDMRNHLHMLSHWCRDARLRVVMWDRATHLYIKYWDGGCQAHTLTCVL